MKWANRLRRWFQMFVMDAKARNRNRRLANQYNDRTANRQLRDLLLLSRSAIKLNGSERDAARESSRNLVDSVFNSLNEKGPHNES